MPKLQYSLALLCAAFALAFTTIAAQSKVRISERTKFYNVSGKTGADVARSIRRKGPRRGHAIATTQSSIKVRNLKITKRGNRCVVANVDVVVNLTYTFPRWRNARRAPASTRRAWNGFYEQIRKHEFTHGRISRQYARELHKKLSSLSGRISRGCQDFGRFHARTLATMQRDFVRRQRNFDRREGRAFSRVRRLQRVFVRSR